MKRAGSALLPEPCFRLIDPGSKPGDKKKIEMFINGEWRDISGVRGMGFGSNYRLRWTDHCLKFYPPYKPVQPLVTHYDKDGNVLDNI